MSPRGELRPALPAPSGSRAGRRAPLGAALLALFLAAAAGTPDAAGASGAKERNRVQRRRLADPIYNVIDGQYRKTDVESLIRIHTPSQLQERRRALIRLVFGREVIPSWVAPKLVKSDVQNARLSRIPSLAGIDELEYTMEHDIGSSMYFLHAKPPAAKLAIYQHGHAEDFIAGKEILSALLSAGCDVIAMSMPLEGRNNNPLVKVDHLGWIRFDRHEWMKFLDRPLRFFMEPIAAALNYGLAQEGKKYDDVLMVGFSGGGWATTVYAAMDPRVRRSYPVAGTAPLYLRSSLDEGRYEGETGDFEQGYPELLRTANYLEMYVMGAAGKGRRQLQVINRYDLGVPSHGIKHSTYLEAVRERVKSLGPGEFDVFLDETKVPAHRVRESTLVRIVQDLLED